MGERRLMNEELERIPDAKNYPSIHGLINKERVINYLPQMKRNQILDEIARNHAELMCGQGKILLPTNAFAKYNNFDCLSSFAWNVGYGFNKQDIQNSFMASNTTKKNVLNPKFQIMGVGSAMDSEGHLYICQV